MTELKHMRTLTILSADKDAEQMEFSCTVAGMKNGTATLKMSLAVSLKVKHIIYYMTWQSYF